MGAHASCFCGLLAKLEEQTRPSRLLDDYFLGQELGRGAFGIIYACTNKKSRLECAVKSINRRRSSAACIDREVDMLRELAHPCVVKLREVYSGARHVDMVFDICRGGDMTTGLLRSKSEGHLPMAVVQTLSLQIFRGIEWLHQNHVVHRDIKGDNYLLDRVDLEHPECRIFLSDFGTAIKVQPEERLIEHCGTRVYWAPEFHDQSYALKVDVWAAGIVMYGLLTCRFPFADERQVRTKELKIPSQCGEAVRSFLLGALMRDEAQRLSASEALKHPFLEPSQSAEHAADASSEASPQTQATKSCHRGGETFELSLPPASCRSEAATTASGSEEDDFQLQLDASTMDSASPAGPMPMLSATQLSSC